MPRRLAVMNETLRDDRKRFCEFLRSGRESRDMSLEDIARITRIPQRSLERLECGDFEALPADVFVRGFLRAYAQCVGIDADDALRRYASIGLPTSPVAEFAVPPNVRARVQGGFEPALARGSVQGTPAPELLAQSPAVVAEPAEPGPETKIESSAPTRTSSSRGGKKKRRKKRRNGRSRSAQRKPADAAPADAALADAAPAEVVPAPAPSPASETRVVTAPTPVLVIDDAAPDNAERIQAERAASIQARRDESRRTFLPQVLLDTDERSSRGALTLAVIILVIVATLTMSYLLRRPSSSGDGVTELTPSQIIQTPTAETTGA